MDNNDFNSKKFFLLLVLVCILFFIIIMNAFEYLPNEEKNLSSEEKINKQMPAEETMIPDNIAKPKKDFFVQLPKTDYELMLEEISPPPQLNEGAVFEELSSNIDSAIANKPENTAENILSKANSLVNSKQYVQAIEQYKQVETLTTDTDIIASSYDGIAKVYAINRRYGTALAFAIKAYNMAPTTYREVILARLYYKSGDVEKATKRLNNLLQRDFADDK